MEHEFSKLSTTKKIVSERKFSSSFRNRCSKILMTFEEKPTQCQSSDNWIEKGRGGEGEVERCSREYSDSKLQKKASDLTWQRVLCADFPSSAQIYRYASLVRLMGLQLKIQARQDERGGIKE